MTAILGAVGPVAATADRDLPRLFESLRRRAAFPGSLWQSNGAVLAAGSLPWESGVAAWRGPLVHDCGRFVVAADACLFRIDHADEAAGVDPQGPATSATVVARLVEHHGVRFGDFIDGDFALAIWDKVAQRLILARDSWGQRPVAWTIPSGGGVLFATSPAALVQHPAVRRTLDLDYIAAAAARLAAPGDRTPYADVRMLAAGTTVIISRDGTVSRRHRRELPAFGASIPWVARDKAARELQHRLVTAVARRLPSEPAAVWLSGGVDSPAVLAAGVLGRRRGVHNTELRAVSLSYPEGDVGREDQFIEEIATRLGTRPLWVYTRDVRLLEGAEQRAREREDPLAHPFEPVQRVLARAARDAGCRIVLDGNGGDQAFAASIVARADALQAGRWGELIRQYRGSRLPLRAFARPAILPLLSRGTREWIGSLRGRRLRGYWDDPVPNWMRARESISTAAQSHVDPEPGECATAFEARFLLTHPHLARVVSWVHAFGLEEGILLRSPLLDLDVVALAASRPAEERFDGQSVKLILRESMRGILPEPVLAPRALKTGTPVDYVKREYGAGLVELLRSRFSAGRQPILSDIGVVDNPKLQSALADFESNGDYQLGHRLYAVLQVEWWLAAHG